MADVTVDTLLLVGFKRSQKTATRIHPFGFGKEAYFWTLLAGIVMLLITATMSFYFGMQAFLHPEGDTVKSIWTAYVILAVGIVTNGYSISVSARKLLEGRRLRALPKALVSTMHVAPRTTFALDSSGLLASTLGMVALIIYGFTGDARFDGLGAMVIGILLAVGSIFLLSSAKTFIVGRRASPEVEHKLKQAALKVSGVNAVLDLRTMVLGHRGLLVNIEVHFQDNMVTDDIEKTVDKVKRKIDQAVEGRVYAQVEPETPRKPRRKRSNNNFAHQENTSEQKADTAAG
jgi:cation diffusion facilitator family transporter